MFFSFWWGCQCPHIFFQLNETKEVKIIGIISTTLNVDWIEDEPVISRMRATTIGDDIKLAFNLGDALVWMTLPQAAEFRRALAPKNISKLLEEMSD